MTTGVLAMSYGTARGLDDVQAYYTHVRRGRPPTPELLRELKDRYRAIGGRSPLIDITEAQVAGLEKTLNEDPHADGGDEFRVYHGMKHQRPYLEDVVAQMAGDGVERAVGLVLAPHYSRFSVGEYVERVERAAAASGGPRFTFVRSYAMHPAFVEFVADRVAAARDLLPPDLRDRAPVVFSAHSLPERILASGDPYPDELQATADAVAARLGLPPTGYRTAWQSAGRTGEPWLGPDLTDVLCELAAAGVRAAVSCPVGFVCDHLEILYDVDIEAQGVALKAGLALVRTESPNDDPVFLAALAEVIRDHLREEEPHP